MNGTEHIGLTTTEEIFESVIVTKQECYTQSIRKHTHTHIKCSVGRRALEKTQD